MNTTQSSDTLDAAYNRAVGAFLLNELCAAPPAALANARRPQAAARALASIEAVLLKMTEGASLEDALAARKQDRQHAPTTEVLDRDDVAELRALAVASQEHHRQMGGHVALGRDRILARAEDPDDAGRSVDTTVDYHRRAERASGEEVEKYDAMLRSDAASWRLEPCQS
jgi:hypothetical protein